MNLRADLDYMVGIRRQLHMYPETGFDLPKTLELVRGELGKMDIPYTERYGKSGIVATLNEDKSHFTICIRADMDALPITEINEVPYKSRHEGKMHACGHDAHTAILLGVARALSPVRERIGCRVKFLFQPSEEGMETGAKLMVDDGVMDEVDCILALHMDNNVNVGAAAFIPGLCSAANTAFIIDLYGKSSHTNRPDRGVDAIAMGVQVFTGLQFIMSRGVNPLDTYTLNVGSFQAGHTNNVMADHCRLLCTLRTHNPDTPGLVMEQVERMIKAVADGAGGRAELTFNKKLPAVINDELLNEKVMASAARVLGEENIIRLRQPGLGAEDFSFYQTKKPGVFFRIGSRNEAKGFVNTAHQANWDIDENALENGAAVMLRFVTDNMNERGITA